MYRILRNTHLILGLAGVLFVLAYAVSAVQMAHRIRVAPTVREEDLVLAPALEGRAAAQQLMDSKGYWGDLGNIRTTPAGLAFALTRPGVNYNVTYEPASGKTHVKESIQGFLGMLNRLHHLHGLRHANGSMNAWGWSLVVVSLGLLVSGGTGLWMWFKLRQERLVGTVLLFANLAASALLLVLLRIGV